MLTTVQTNQDLNKLRIAMDITRRFEGTSYTTVTDDFDGMGFSVGVLQWNVGQMTFQKKLLAPFLSSYPDRFSFPFPVEPLLAFSREAALTWVRHEFYKDGKMKHSHKTALKEWLLLPEVQQLQMRAVHELGARASMICYQWQMSSLRSFAWAFDIVVQNGSLLTVTKPTPDIARVDAIIERYGIKNWERWADFEPSPEQQILVIASHLRAQLSRVEYRSDVFSRKAAIAYGFGHVHGKDFEFPELIEARIY